MDWIFIVIGSLFILAGILGCFLPVLPGPPISWAALLLISFSARNDVSGTLLLYTGLLAVLVQVLDYIVPIWGTKKFGGTKAGVWGSTIGLIVGIILLPMLGIIIGPFGILGILGGPFLGALIGEKMAGQNSDTAMKAAIGSFLGFLAGTLIKLVASSIITWYFVKSFF